MTEQEQKDQWEEFYNPYTDIYHSLHYLAKKVTAFYQNATPYQIFKYRIKRRIGAFLQALESSIWYAISETIMDQIQRRYQIEFEWRVVTTLSNFLKKDLLGKIGPTTFNECRIYLVVAFRKLSCLKRRGYLDPEIKKTRVNPKLPGQIKC